MSQTLEYAFKVPYATARQVIERYRALVEKLYVEPKEEEIIGSLILNMDEDFSTQQRRTRHYITLEKLLLDLQHEYEFLYWKETIF